jgi:hypothetical protein
MIASTLGCQDQLPPGLPPKVVRQNGKRADPVFPPDARGQVVRLPTH